MNHELNPLEDEEDHGKRLPTRESIKSFWLGCCGLAIFALSASVAAFASSRVDVYIASILVLPYNQVMWSACEGTHAVIRGALIPSLVLGALVPILYWRGSLVQRFAISVVLAITVMNLTMGRMGAEAAKVPVWQLIGILCSWIVMPVIFLWTPVATRSLRLVVASCLLAMSLCLSMLHMLEAPQNINLIYWEMVYGAAFGYALVRRNWGRIAILESDTHVDQIERTSSRTLLELMAVCGLACAATMYWSTEFNLGILIHLAEAAILGICCVLASMACIRSVFHRTERRLLKLLVLGLFVSLIFCVSGMVYFAVYDPWETRNWRNFAFMFTRYEVPLAIAITSLLASPIYIGFMLLVGYYLKWCGWRAQDQVPSANVEVDGALSASTKIAQPRD